jgi:hypothetical protein
MTDKPKPAHEPKNGEGGFQTADSGNTSPPPPPPPKDPK